MDVQILVSQTVSQILDFYFNDSPEELLKCIIEFYSKCASESLRIATMDLIIKTHKSLSLSKDAKDEHLIYKIYSRFKKSMKDKDENDIKIIHAAEVPENTWLNAWIICFETVVHNDISKRFSELDQLFHIHKPETEGRKALIEASVQKLFKNKSESAFKTVIGLILSFDMDFSALSTVSQSKCPIKSLRTATMELIIKTYNTLFTLKCVDCLIEQIYNKFEILLKGKKINNIDSAKIPRNTWMDAFEICFKIILQKKSVKSFLTLDQLFHIREPETNARKAFIYESIRQLLKNENTFKKGIQLIVSFNIKMLKEEEFENILFYSFIYANGRTFTTDFFISFEDKLQCLQILDDCFARAQTKESPKTEIEKEFLNSIDSIEVMPEMIHKLAKTSVINIEEHNFHSCKEYFFQNLKSAFNFMDKLYFDLYVLDSLKERNKKYKLDFLEFISYDLKYAYCWAKKLKVSQENMPLFLQNCKHFESDANKFVQLMSKDISLFAEKDSVETCKFWGKTYELITVITPKCFDDFVEKYFIKQKPKIVGIDCEAHPYTSCITVLQLATPNWICLIDVQILFDKISQNIWKKFFQQLFHPSITRIGFSFQSDYIFMCKKFHFLSYLISEKERKVLCLQTLTNSILQDGCDISSIFGCKISADIGLSKLSKAVLNINLDKSLQKSDWTKRPLTQLQKIYAVSDALVVVLIKKEMEKRLQKTFGHSTAQKMINKGFITYKKFMKKPN